MRRRQGSRSKARRSGRTSTCPPRAPASSRRGPAAARRPRRCRGYRRAAVSPACSQPPRHASARWSWPFPGARPACPGRSGGSGCRGARFPCARSRRAQAWYRRCGFVWHIPRGTSGHARSRSPPGTGRCNPPQPATRVVSSRAQRVRPPWPAYRLYDQHARIGTAIAPMPRNPQQSTGAGFALRLRAFYGALFITLGVQMPFLPVWLAAMGLDAPTIGLVLALPMVVRVFAIPMATRLADRHDALRIVIVAVTVGAVAGYGVLGLAQGAAAIMIVYTVAAAF